MADMARVMVVTEPQVLCHLSVIHYIYKVQVKMLQRYLGYQIISLHVPGVRGELSQSMAL